MCYRLVTYIVKMQLLSSVHYAYLRGRSTQDCITFIVDKILRNKKKNRDTHAIFFDFSSAFDTIRFNVLLWKLENEFFISGRFMELLRSFLTGRQSAVKFLGMISNWRLDSIGIPQGGALSPILFLLYINGISVISRVGGVHWGIFADDLCIFSDGVRRLKLLSRFNDMDLQAINGIQEGIFFIQWYSLVNGLKLNYDKTNYKVFTKTRNWANVWKADFHLSAGINNDYGDTAMDEDVILDCVKDPIKYLGIWMDTHLDWRFHCDKILEKCNKIYWTIQSNLSMIWSIKSVIAWQIFDTCILSILDYSFVIMPLMQQQDRTKLDAFFRRMIRKVFHVPKHTPLDTLYHQLDTLDFDSRWKCKIAQYFTHLIRLPVTSVLSAVVYNSWWKVIKDLANMKSPNWRNLEKMDPRYKFHSETIIWFIVKYAVQSGSSDIEGITRNTDFFGIAKEFSYYLDLTPNWKYINFDPVPFTDDSFTKLPRNDGLQELLIFTDGSVESRAGGYGVHMVPSTLYGQWCGRSQDEYNQAMECNLRHQALRMDKSRELSTRCSIDFCEVMAIHTSLSQLWTWIKGQTQVYHFSWDYNDIMRSKFGIKSARIISDSLTVLNWLNGSYQIKNRVMKRFIDEIH